ncbi:recombinase RecT, partial [Candidatus Woesearchaeota archaeon]
MGNSVAVQPKNIVDRVGLKIKALVTSNEITLPTGYSAGNAMKEALLMLQETVDRNKKPALSVCTPESIA